MEGKGYKLLCHVLTVSHESHAAKLLVMCVTVAHLVGEFSCNDAILDEQHNSVVCDYSHQEEEHHPRKKPSLLQS